MRLRSINSSRNIWRMWNGVISDSLQLRNSKPRKPNTSRERNCTVTNQHLLKPSGTSAPTSRSGSASLSWEVLPMLSQDFERLPPQLLMKRDTDHYQRKGGNVGASGNETQTAFISARSGVWRSDTR